MMKRAFKLAAVGALVTFSMATAAPAQQSAAREPVPPEAPRQVTSGGGMMDHGSMMMNDPEMRRQMTRMMDACEKMMKRIDERSATAAARRKDALRSSAGRYEWRSPPSYGPRAPLRAPVRVWVPAKEPPAPSNPGAA